MLLFLNVQHFIRWQLGMGGSGVSAIAPLNFTTESDRTPPTFHRRQIP
ncbi:hypothetical protein [Scytonema sp. PRP1]